MNNNTYGEQVSTCKRKHFGVRSTELEMTSNVFKLNLIYRWGGCRDRWKTGGVQSRPMAASEGSSFWALNARFPEANVSCPCRALEQTELSSACEKDREQCVLCSSPNNSHPCLGAPQQPSIETTPPTWCWASPRCGLPKCCVISARAHPSQINHSPPRNYAQQLRE